jgi:probable HAF family extracellular repeat protein
VISCAACLATVWFTNEASAATYTLTDLSPLGGGTLSAAYAINNAGRVVGFSDSSTAPTQATIWNRSGTPVSLGTLSVHSQVWGINNRGQRVGESSGPGPTQATIWNGRNISLGVRADAGQGAGIGRPSADQL